MLEYINWTIRLFSTNCQLHHKGGTELDINITKHHTVMKNCIINSEKLISKIALLQNFITALRSVQLCQSNVYSFVNSLAHSLSISSSYQRNADDFVINSLVIAILNKVLRRRINFNTFFPCSKICKWQSSLKADQAPCCKSLWSVVGTGPIGNDNGNSTHALLLLSIYS